MITLSKHTVCPAKEPLKLINGRVSAINVVPFNEYPITTLEELVKTNPLSEAIPPNILSNSMPENSN